MPLFAKQIRIHGQIFITFLINFDIFLLQMTSLKITLRVKQKYTEMPPSRIQEYMLACTLQLQQVRTEIDRQQQQYTEMPPYRIQEYKLACTFQLQQVCTEIQRQIVKYTEDYSFRILEYTLACTLQLQQVRTEIDTIVHRDASIQDTRVHACLYFIAPTGTHRDRQIATQSCLHS